jgi:hypothetical protein
LRIEGKVSEFDIFLCKGKEGIFLPTSLLKGILFIFLVPSISHINLQTGQLHGFKRKIEEK